MPLWPLAPEARLTDAVSCHGVTAPMKAEVALKAAVISKRPVRTWLVTPAAVRPRKDTDIVVTLTSCIVFLVLQSYIYEQCYTEVYMPFRLMKLHLRVTHSNLITWLCGLRWHVWARSLFIPRTKPARVTVRTLPCHGIAGFLVLAGRTHLTTVVSIGTQWTTLVTACAVPPWIAGVTGAVHCRARLASHTVTTPGQREARR